MEKGFYTVKDVASYIAVSPNTVRDWIKTGRIPFYKINGAVRFNVKDIANWLKKKDCKYARKSFDG